MKNKILTIAAVAALGLSSCTQRISDLTVISSKNIDIENKTFKILDERVTGEDKKHIIVFIPTGQPSMKEAIDRAIESQKGGVALSDASIEIKWWWIPYIYGQNTIKVEGNPVVKK